MDAGLRFLKVGKSREAREKFALVLASRPGDPIALAGMRVTTGDL